MADNYKILAQGTASDVEENSGENQANILYTVPENTQAAISSISLVNTSEEDVEYSLGVVKAEDVGASLEESAQSVAGPNSFALVTGSSQFPSGFSTDGISWTKTSLPQGNWIGIASGNGRFVAVASNSNQAAYSTNGTTWTISFIPQPQLTVQYDFRAIAFGNGMFVAVAYYGSSYSTDGVTWANSQMPSFTQYFDVAFADNKFVAVSYSSAAISTDGITWTGLSLPHQSGLSSIAGGEKGFVIFEGDFFPATSFFLYSTNGIIWTVYYLSNQVQWSSVTYGDGKFVAAANIQSFGLFSTNGTSWSSFSLPFALVAPSVSYGGDKFVITALNGNLYSTDLITWSGISGLPANSVAKVASGALSQTIIGTKNSLSNAQTIIPTRLIEPTSVDEISGGITLSAGDQIRIFSESPDLIVQVYGVEIS